MTCEQVEEAERKLTELMGYIDKEAKASKPVVKADEHNAVTRETGTRIDRRRTTSIHKAAAMNPDHNRQLRPGLGIAWRPYIEEEAVLGRGGAQWRTIEREQRLQTIAAVLIS